MRFWDSKMFWRYHLQKQTNRDLKTFFVLQNFDTLKQLWEKNREWEMYITAKTRTARSVAFNKNIARPIVYERTFAIFYIWTHRVVSRFLSRRFLPKSRRLFPFYFSNITLRTDLLIFGVTGTVFKIAGEMRRLLAYFDNPGLT